MINFFNCVGNNTFLKKMYPNGVRNVALKKVVSQVEHPLWLYLNIYEKPAVEVNKYGVWQKDYNCLTLEFTVQFLTKMILNDLYKNRGNNCFFDFNIENGLLCLKLSSQNNLCFWKAEIISDDGFIFQSTSPSLLYMNGIV